MKQMANVPCQGKGEQSRIERAALRYPDCFILHTVHFHLFFFFPAGFNTETEQVLVKQKSARPDGGLGLTNARKRRKFVNFCENTEFCVIFFTNFSLLFWMLF